MDKLTYLAELAEGLARWVPERERQDILRYYAEYFEEAGPDKEAQVVRELGDPWALSCRLAVEGGYVSQQQAQSWAPKARRKTWPLVAVASVACVAIVAVSAATFFSRIGGMVGRKVAGLVTSEAEVDVMRGEPQAVEEGYGFTPVISYPPNGQVTYVEDAECIGGFWSMEDGCLDPFEAVDVDISFGNVTVTGGGDYTLAIQKEGVGDYDLKWAVKDGRLKIEDARSGGYQVNWTGVAGQHYVDVIVTVPEGGPGLEKLEAKTSLGDVFLSRLSVEGKVKAETDLGNVECYEVRAFQKLTLKSKLGDVTLGQDELWDGIDMELKSNLGQVEAQLNCREGECGYELDCDLGVVTVNGQKRGDKAEQKGSSPYQLDAGSDLGDVNVYFQDDRF